MADLASGTGTASFGNRLRRLRSAASLSQEDLAERTFWYRYQTSAEAGIGCGTIGSAFGKEESLYAVTLAVPQRGCMPARRRRSKESR